jgi:prepilin-type processing-associated H-X9-DG protein
MQYLANAGGASSGLASFNKNDGAIGDNASYSQASLNNPPNAPVPNPTYSPVSLDDIRRGDGQSSTLLITETIIRRDGDTMLWDLHWVPYTTTLRLPPPANQQNSVIPAGYPDSFMHNSTVRVRRTPAEVTDINSGLAFGFANLNSVPASTQVINQGIVGGQAPASLTGLHVWPKSRHSGGCYVAFVDGSARFLKNDLPPHIYGHLMTSRSVHDASGPTGQKYITNSPLANRYLAAPSGPVPYVLQPDDY